MTTTGHLQIYPDFFSSLQLANEKKQIQQLYTGNNEGDPDKWNNKVKFQ